MRDEFKRCGFERFLVGNGNHAEVRSRSRVGGFLIIEFDKTERRIDVNSYEVFAFVVEQNGIRESGGRLGRCVRKSFRLVVRIGKDVVFNRADSRVKSRFGVIKFAVFMS